MRHIHRIQLRADGETLHRLKVLSDFHATSSASVVRRLVREEFARLRRRNPDFSMSATITRLNKPVKKEAES